MSDEPAPRETPAERLKRMKAEMADLEAEIAEAEREAKAVIGHPEGPTFAQSGSVGTENIDDAIAPPG